MAPDTTFRRRANWLHEATGASGTAIGCGIGVWIGCPPLVFIVVGIALMAVVLVLVLKWEVDINA